jgi:hypothetical protein
VSACLAVALGDSARIGFGAAALVFLVTAAYAAGTVWLETREFPPLDIEAPPPTLPPLPQSPVTEIYDPPSPPNNRLQRTGEG